MTEEAKSSTPAPAAAPSAPAADAPKAPLSFGDLDDMFSRKEAKEPLPFNNNDGDDDDADETQLQENEQEDSESDYEGGEDSEESDEEDSEAGEGSDEESEEEGFDRSKLSAEDLAKKYKVKVDGKEKAYSLEQLLTNASSGFHTKARHEQFEAQKQEFATQRQGFEQTLANQQARIAVADAIVSPVMEALEKKDAMGALSALAPHLGSDSLQIERNLLRNALPQIAERLGLSAEEVKQRLQANAEKNRTLDLQQEAKFFREKSEKEQRLREQAAAPNPEVEAQRAVKDFAVSQGVTLEQLNKAADLAAELVGDPEAVTFEHIATVIARRKVVDRALDTIEARRPALSTNVEFVDSVIAAVIANPSWSARQLGGFVEEEARKIVLAKKGSLERNISKKVQKSNLRPRFENSSQGRKPMKFSDLPESDGLI